MTRQFCLTYLLIALIFINLPSSTLTAQESPYEIQANPWVLTYDEPRSNRVNQIETFPTETQAIAAKRLKEWTSEHDRLNGNPVSYTNLKITKRGPGGPANALLETLERAPAAVDRARRMLENREVILKGDTLREYRSLLQKVYDSVTQFKSDLVAQTGKVNRQVFDQANRKIADYNRQAEEYNSWVSSPGFKERIDTADNPKGSRGGPRRSTVDILTPFEAVQPVSEFDLNGSLESNLTEEPGNSASSLAGKEGEGKFSTGDIKINFEEGAVTFGAGLEAIRGRLIQHGNEVKMRTDSYDYQGTIIADRIVGNRISRNGIGKPESWTISLAVSEPEPPVVPAAKIVGLWKGEYIVTCDGKPSSKDLMTVKFHEDGIVEKEETTTLFYVTGEIGVLKPTTRRGRWALVEGDRLEIYWKWSNGDEDSDPSVWAVNGETLTKSYRVDKSAYVGKLTKQ